MSKEHEEPMSNNETDATPIGKTNESDGRSASSEPIPEIQIRLERLVNAERQTKQWVNSLVTKSAPIDASFLRHLSSCVGYARDFLLCAAPDMVHLEGTVFEQSAIHVLFYRLGVPVLGDSHEHAAFFTQWKKDGQVSIDLSAGFASEMMLTDPGSVRVADWSLPFDGMRLSLPNPACPIILETKKGEQRVKYITVHRSRRLLPGVPVFGIRTEYMTGANDFVSFVSELRTYVEAAIGALDQYNDFTEETIVMGLHTGYGACEWIESPWVCGSLAAEQAQVPSIGAKMQPGEAAHDALEGTSEERATNDVAFASARRLVVNTLLSFGTKDGSAAGWSRLSGGVARLKTSKASADIIRIAGGLSSGQNPIEVTRAMVSAGRYVEQDNELVPVVFEAPEALGTGAVASSGPAAN
jgi:hypothetical protein